MDFSPEALRKHFHALTAKHDKIQDKLQPLRDELDALVVNEKITVGERNKREAKIRPQIVKLQQELYPVEMERAAVARALGGKTGEPDAE